MKQENTLVVAALYKFVKLPDFANKQDPLLSYCLAQGVKGTILLAAEGINGTIAGSRHAIDSVVSFLRSDPRLADIEHKESYTNTPPFELMKVRLKREIVTLGLPEVDPNQQVGKYVSPLEWNDLICDPEVTVIDTRNDYEVNIGTFKGAQNPQTETFREFPEYVRHQTNIKKLLCFVLAVFAVKKLHLLCLPKALLKFITSKVAFSNIWKKFQPKKVYGKASVLSLMNG